VTGVQTCALPICLEIGFLDKIVQTDVEVDVPAVVVINERTGTIVVGGNVTILETAVAQGSLVVKIKEQQTVSQPTTSFTDGATTQKVDDTSIAVDEKEGVLIALPKTVTVDELARALNAIGASPRDLIAIFDALKKAGALQARLEMM
jgi:flagellar P-ring protein precursor FlgI